MERQARWNVVKRKDRITSAVQSRWEQGLATQTSVTRSTVWQAGEKSVLLTCCRIEEERAEGLGGPASDAAARCRRVGPWRSCCVPCCSLGELACRLVHGLALSGTALRPLELCIVTSAHTISHRMDLEPFLFCSRASTTTPMERV